MTFLSYIREGFQIAARHKRVVIVLWLVPMIPAVVLAVMASANLMPNLGPSIFADRVLDGDWFVVWSEFRSSPGYALAPILTTGVVVMAFLSLLANIVVAAGVVEVVLEREESRPFMIGVRRNFLSFARTTILLALGTFISGLAAWAVVRGSFKLAAAKADGRLDLAGVAGRRRRLPRVVGAPVSGRRFFADRRRPPRRSLDDPRIFPRARGGVATPRDLRPALCDLSAAAVGLEPLLLHVCGRRGRRRLQLPW